MQTKTSRFGCVLAAGAFLLAASQAAQAQRAPAKPLVMIEPMLTVLSTAHYQATAGNSCSGSACSVAFPAPGKKKRLTVTRVYCLLQTTNGPSLNYARAELLSSVNSLLMAQYVTQTIKSLSGTITLNDAIDLQVGATEHINVTMTLTGNTADYMLCAISGTLATLG